MNMNVVSRTHVGRVRTNNEDNFFADAASGLFIVCDGMGGHNAGEVASKFAATPFAKSSVAPLPYVTNTYKPANTLTSKCCAKP